MRTKLAGDLAPGDVIRIHPREGWIRITSVRPIPPARRYGASDLEIRGTVLRPIPRGSMESFDVLYASSSRSYELRSGRGARATSP